MTTSVPEDLFFSLILRMGGKDTHLEGGRLTWTNKKSVIAVADVEPVLTWFAAAPFTWTTPRSAIVRDVPSPADTTEARDLAFAAARTFGAISVHGEAQLDDRCRVQSLALYALTSFRRLSTEAPAARTKAATSLVKRTLATLATTLMNEVVRHGSAGARGYAERVSDRAALVRLVALHYVADLPLAARVIELVERLDAWSLRALIPTDEALKVAAEIGAEARSWR